MPVTVVVGAQWGDEGKAKVIDLLAADHTYVVRYQGGHNAGHTVVVDDQKYALQLVPSGVLYPHVTPVIGNGVVVDLPTLFREVDTLQGRGIDCSKLRVSSQAHLIFPWHQAIDALREASRGDARIGTAENRRDWRVIVDRGGVGGGKVIQIPSPLHIPFVPAHQLVQRLARSGFRPIRIAHVRLFLPTGAGAGAAHASIRCNPARMRNLGWQGAFLALRFQRPPYSFGIGCPDRYIATDPGSQGCPDSLSPPCTRISANLPLAP